jgi:hypothetical protein
VVSGGFCRFDFISEAAEIPFLIISKAVVVPLRAVLFIINL